MNKKSQIDIKKSRYFEALFYSYEILSIGYENLYSNCIKIKEDNKLLVSVLSQCWSTIDTINRIREISQSLPGLNSKDQNLKSFLEETEVTEYFRNYFQHLRQELGMHKDIFYPVYGSLSWVDNKNDLKCHSVLIGLNTNKMRHSFCIFDNYEKKFVSKVTLNLENAAYNFDIIYESAIKFKEYIIKWLKENTDFDLNISLDKLQIISAEIK